MERKVYIEIIENNGNEIRTLANAESEADAMQQELDKFKKRFGLYRKGYNNHSLFGILRR